MNLKKYFSIFTLVLSVSLLTPAFAAEEASGVIDDSIRDMSIVLGSGVGGAVLGLSTLSFVDTPSKHWKNVAIGGAIGVVIGVGIVIFNQAAKTTLSSTNSQIPMNPEKFASLSRQNFSELKIANDYMKTPSLGYTFGF